MADLNLKDIFSIFSAGGPSSAQLAAVGLKVKAVETQANTALSDKLRTFGVNWGAFLPTNLINSVAAGAATTQNKSTSKVNATVAAGALSSLQPYLPFIIAGGLLLIAYHLRRKL